MQTNILILLQIIFANLFRLFKQPYVHICLYKEVEFYKYIINQIQCEKVLNKNNKQQNLTLEWVENKF